MTSKVKGSSSKTETDKASSPQTGGSNTIYLLSAFILAAAILFYQFIIPFWSSAEEEVPLEQFVQVPCSEQSYAEEAALFPRCIPRIRCGRFASESFITSEEADRLIDLAQRGMWLTQGGSGGATILDLASGAISHGEQFASIWDIPKINDVLGPADFEFFSTIHTKVKTKISNLFGIPLDSFYLTRPCFFSRLNPNPAKTLNDEYWHNHVDKETYGKFIYTALIYLTTYDADFGGGRFIFVDDKKNMTVMPKKGLFVTFSSGAENPHLVERVTRGVRFALTVAFACDPAAAVDVPKWREK